MFNELITNIRCIIPEYFNSPNSEIHPQKKMFTFENITFLNYLILNMLFPN